MSKDPDFAGAQWFASPHTAQETAGIGCDERVGDTGIASPFNEPYRDRVTALSKTTPNKTDASIETRRNHKKAAERFVQRLWF